MWFFNSAKIIFGREALDQLENPLHVSGKKALIVTDKDLVQLNMVDIVTKHLDSAKIEYQIYDGVLPDPPVSTILTGAELCKEYAPDLIIGFGGGSSMDTAKGIWAIYEGEEGFDITGLNPFMRIPTGTKSKLIAIPTTSGTGAEATAVIVITDDKTGLKLELPNPDVMPTIAIVDPIFVDNMPKKLTSSTGFDAVSHCIENICGKWHNIYSDGLAALAMSLIFKNLPLAYAESDPDAREAMHNAATIAGLSFGNAQAQLGHSIGHALGAVFHIPHGFAVGLVLPYLMQYLIKHDAYTVKAFSTLAKSCGVAEWKDNENTAAQKLLKAVQDLQQKVEFPTTLPDLGVTNEELDANIDRFKELVLQSAAITISPVDVTGDLVVKIVYCMVDGNEIDF
ncbi:MAG TPA: iron-containing alcohol dehydrogenase [Candidatus Lokiarchaeia archaeon]|nr:iron-containing alcohol dehydrogenase [Candidatus Lokiarchaeia archaeon]